MQGEKDKPYEDPNIISDVASIGDELYIILRDLNGEIQA